jgi:hypothetical protein
VLTDVTLDDMFSSGDDVVVAIVIVVELAFDEFALIGLTVEVVRLVVIV